MRELTMIRHIRILSERYLLPTLVVILGIHGLIGNILDIKASRALSYLLLTTPLPLAYSSPEISARVDVTGIYRDGHQVSRSVTRAELGQISGPFQRRTPLIYLFTRPHQLGAPLVHPALEYLFCTPAVALSEFGLTRSTPLRSLSWRVSYQGVAPQESWTYDYQCHSTPTASDVR